MSHTDRFLTRYFHEHPDPRVRRASLHAIAGTVHEKTLDRLHADLLDHDWDGTDEQLNLNAVGYDND